ncbi:hypothetical protein ACSHWB_16265 [Lentzea sp. HUAS TT2]|uniref:hypothetical protein n=1 Tax=Lentzea sp. HUAS TT2 TaxID=3447454 RepID=UPI003F6E77D9
MALTETLAIFGAASGGASLLWNVAAWRMSGSSVSVRVGTGVYSRSGREALTLPVPRDQAKEGINVYDVPLSTGGIEPVLIVTVYSKGRLAVGLSGLRFVGPGGMQYVPPAPLEGALPARLDVGAPPHNVVLPLNKVQVAMHTALQRIGSSEMQCRVVVDLGNGKSIQSKPIRFYTGEDPYKVDALEQPDQAE